METEPSCWTPTQGLHQSLDLKDHPQCPLSLTLTRTNCAQLLTKHCAHINWYDPYSNSVWSVGCSHFIAENVTECNRGRKRFRRSGVVTTGKRVKLGLKSRSFHPKFILGSQFPISPLFLIFLPCLPTYSPCHDFSLRFPSTNPRNPNDKKLICFFHFVKAYQSSFFLPICTCSPEWKVCNENCLRIQHFRIMVPQH